MLSEEGEYWGDDKCVEIIPDSVFYWPHLSGLKCNKTNYLTDLGSAANSLCYDGEDVLLPIWSHHQVLLWHAGPTSLLSAREYFPSCHSTALTLSVCWRCLTTQSVSVLVTAALEEEEEVTWLPPTPGRTCGTWPWWQRRATGPAGSRRPRSSWPSRSLSPSSSLLSGKVLCRNECRDFYVGSRQFVI